MKNKKRFILVSFLFSVFVFFFLVQEVSADCFSRAPIGPNLEPGDTINCYSIPCSNSPPSLSKLGWCSRSRITNCNCEGNTQVIGCGEYSTITEWFYPRDLFNQDYTPDLKSSTGWKQLENNAPSCLVCGDCGTRNSEGKCKSNDPAGDNNCFYCFCDETQNPNCEKLLDLTGKVGACRKCDYSGNIIYAVGDSCTLQDGKQGVCDSQGNCEEKIVEGVYKTLSSSCFLTNPCSPLNNCPGGCTYANTNPAPSIYPAGCEFNIIEYTNCYVDYSLPSPYLVGEMGAPAFTKCDYEETEKWYHDGQVVELRRESKKVENCKECPQECQKKNEGDEITINGVQYSCILDFFTKCLFAQVKKEGECLPEKPKFKKNDGSIVDNCGKLELKCGCPEKEFCVSDGSVCCPEEEKEIDGGNFSGNLQWAGGSYNKPSQWFGEKVISKYNFWGKRTYHGLFDKDPNSDEYGKEHEEFLKDWVENYLKDKNKFPLLLWEKRESINMRSYTQMSIKKFSYILSSKPENNGELNIHISLLFDWRDGSVMYKGIIERLEELEREYGSLFTRIKELLSQNENSKLLVIETLIESKKNSEPLFEIIANGKKDNKKISGYDYNKIFKVMDGLPQEPLDTKKDCIDGDNIVYQTTIKNVTTSDGRKITAIYCGKAVYKKKVITPNTEEGNFAYVLKKIIIKNPDGSHEVILWRWYNPPANPAAYQKIVYDQYGWYKINIKDIEEIEERIEKCQNQTSKKAECDKKGECWDFNSVKEICEMKPFHTHCGVNLDMVCEVGKCVRINLLEKTIGDKINQVVGKKCFIASTVYGDENAPEVETLREFRDKVLIPNPIGKQFVNFYYSGAGEKTAEFIEEKTPFLIPVIRKGLDFVVERYEEKS